MKTIKTIAAVAAIALPLQFAQAEGATVNAQLAIPSVSGYSGGSAIALGYEMPMPDVNPNFSVEGELGMTLSKPDDSVSQFGVTVGAEFSYTSFAGYGKYNHPVNDKLDVYGRAGLSYVSWKADATCSGDPFICSFIGSQSVSDNEMGLTYGFGMNYSINEQMDFTAGYTSLHKDITLLSAGIKYKL